MIEKLQFESLVEEIKEGIKEYGIYAIEQRVINNDMHNALLEIFDIKEDDLTGMQCFNEETGKTFYMNQAKGKLYEFYLK